MPFMPLPPGSRGALLGLPSTVPAHLALMGCANAQATPSLPALAVPEAWFPPIN
jgi:hypothetical protein